MQTEEHRIVDFIVKLERRIDASRFSVERTGLFARRERIASGYIELDAPGQAPRFILDRAGLPLSPQLEQWLRVRWITMQNELRRERASAQATLPPR